MESITSDKRASNYSMIENIPPKGVIESNFICTLAMFAEDWFDFYRNTKLSESSNMTKRVYQNSDIPSFSYLSVEKV